MKKVLFVVALCAMGATAHATQIMPVLTCSALNSGPDHGLGVDIIASFGPPVFGRPSFHTLTASVSNETIAGPRPVGSWTVKRIDPAPGVLGGSTYFKGRGFSLRVCTTCAPLPGGQRGEVTFEQRGARVSEDLACHFLR